MSEEKLIESLLASCETKDDYIEKLKERIAELRHDLGVSILTKDAPNTAEVHKLKARVEELESKICVDCEMYEDS